MHTLIYSKTQSLEASVQLHRPWKRLHCLHLTSLMISLQPDFLFPLDTVCVLSCVHILCIVEFQTKRCLWFDCKIFCSLGWEGPIRRDPHSQWRQERNCDCGDEDGFTPWKRSDSDPKFRVNSSSWLLGSGHGHKRKRPGLKNLKNFAWPLSYVCLKCVALCYDTECLVSGETIIPPSLTVGRNSHFWSKVSICGRKRNRLVFLHSAFGLHMYGIISTQCPTKIRSMAHQFRER